MLHCPAPMAFTFASKKSVFSTVATDELLELHTSFTEPPSPFAQQVMECSSPTLSSKFSGMMCSSPVSFTVTLHVAVSPPAETDMLHCPAPLAFTFASKKSVFSTVATDVLLVLHTSFTEPLSPIAQQVMECSSPTLSSKVSGMMCSSPVGVTPPPPPPLSLHLKYQVFVIIGLATRPPLSLMRTQQ